MMNTPNHLASVTHLEVSLHAPDWEDAMVGDVDDVDGALIPGRQGDEWKVRIDLKAGRIESWPAGTTALIHYYVRDEGLYWLTDAEGQRLAKWHGHYVPEAFLCHGQQGFGDYIILDVDDAGLIKDYQRPDILAEQWPAMRGADSTPQSAPASDLAPPSNPTA